MKGLKLSTSNISISIYPEQDYVCLQIDKKKTQDKIHLTKEEWLRLSSKVLETCFEKEHENVKNLIDGQSKETT